MYNKLTDNMVYTWSGVWNEMEGFTDWDSLLPRLRSNCFIDGDSYPPYDCYIDKEEKTYFIKIAVAGYNKKDLSVRYEDSYLIVSGVEKLKDLSEKSVPEQKNVYLHKGIKQRPFTIKFDVPNDKYDIDDMLTELKEGILYFEIKARESAKPRTILISDM
jgi:HSP20 family molecular chaperone IbpA